MQKRNKTENIKNLEEVGTVEKSKNIQEEKNLIDVLAEMLVELNRETFHKELLIKSNREKAIRQIKKAFPSKKYKLMDYIAMLEKEIADGNVII